VAGELLDGAQVGAGIEHVGDERVAEIVQREIRHPDRACAAFDQGKYGLGGHAPRGPRLPERSTGQNNAPGVAPRTHGRLVRNSGHVAGPLARLLPDPVEVGA
jgi:hypothetical protein